MAYKKKHNKSSHKIKAMSIELFIKLHLFFVKSRNTKS